MIHQEIDELLTADLHDQLTESERHALHSHLVECAECRQLHKEYQNMNTALDETFAAAKPELGFEQRILAAFRRRVPDKGSGVLRFLVLMIQSRTIRIAAVAVVLLGLVQVGRVVTEKSNGYDHFASIRDGTVEATLAAPVPAIATPQSSSTFSELATKAPADNLTAPGKPASAAFDLQGRGSLVSGGIASDEKDRDRVGYRYGFTADSSDKTAMKRATGAGGVTTTYAGSVRAAASPAPQSADAIEFLQGGRDKSVAIGGEYRAPAAPPVAKSDQNSPNETSSRKLIRNVRTDLEVVNFQDTVEKITTLAREAHGYLATSGSQKQENGKLRGQVVAKVSPDVLDHFLEQLRGLGELKNQTIGTDDVSKNYFDTSARLDNARVMEQRLVEMLKKNTGKVSDLLQVEKELGRVREDIEKMQGELKFIDAQVQFATVTIILSEKDMNVPAAFLLEERARVGLFTSDVEKTYDAIKALASTKVQVTNAHLESGDGGQVSGHINILVAPEQSEATISKIKELGRVQTFEVQTERVAHGGEGMSEEAKTEKDKVQVEVTITREEEEQARQQTSLRIRSGAVDQNAQKLRELAGREGAQVRHSSFNKDGDGREIADFTLRLPMKNYAELMQSLNALGTVEGVTVHREESAGQTGDENTAPADVTIQFYSRGNIVSQDSGLFATLRNTFAQGAGAVMWSVRMIAVALAFIGPWVVAVLLAVWIARRIAKARRSK